MDPVSSVIGLVSTILNKVWGNKDDELKRKFILELQERVGELDLAKKQIDVNVVEAASSNLFVSGWRPCIGWVCAASFAWQFLLQPMISYLIAISGHPIPPMPVFDYMSLNTVLGGILGLGAMRSYERVKGVTK